MPTVGDTAVLIARRNDLTDAPRPGAADAMAIEVLNMFEGYTSVKLDAKQAKRTAAAYVLQIAHLPLWAVERASRECAGRDSPFPVSAGELRAAGEAIVQPIREEQAELRKILEADVYHEPGPGERERVKAAFKNALSAMPVAPSRKPQYSHDARNNGQSAVPEPEPDTRPLPQLSDEALAIVERQSSR